MYNSPVRRRAALGLADVHARQTPADRHTGDLEDFLRRHEMEAKQTAQGSQRDRELFAARLLKRAGDTRNVRLAVDHCASRGQAAGPDGLRPSDLDNDARWSLTNELSQLIQSGSYHSSKPRTKWIDKGNNRGKRPIRIQNFSDRCVERAVLQVIRPLTEAQYLDCSLGFRSPGHSREEALATAERLAYDHDKWTWISEDLKNAFEQIPIARLLQVIRKMIPADSICEFIRQITKTGSKRGIRQGGPLSPELLNIYLHWMLDRWWYQRFPDVPMLRVADDILILTNPQNAESLWNALNERTRTIGMPLKGTPTSAIRDLNARTQSPVYVDWLGYRIQRGQTQLDVAVSDKSWSKLEEHLAKAWEKPSPPLAANDAIRGWISQQGATYREDGVEVMVAGISRLALLYGFDETPGVEELAVLWHQAHLRDWIRERREVLVRVRSGVTPADGFADQHCNFSTVVRDANPSQIVPERREVYLYTDGSCLATKRGVGGWAYLIIDWASGQRREASDSHPWTSNNRMELQAVVEGMSSLSESMKVHVVTDSEYVFRGITKLLPIWIARNWRGKSGRVANKRLWQRLFAQLHRHDVDCELVRGHSGHWQNDHVDRLARAAAQNHHSFSPFAQQSTALPNHLSVLQ